ncbi:MAG: spore germination protein, partial [Oscillospiraceae bacterium]|nr:spore germination protein [Oscillospiraceae bacterium]
MRKDEKLTFYEGFSLLTITFLYHIFNEVIPNLTNDVGTSAWLAQVISACLGFGFLSLYLLLVSRYKNMDLLVIFDTVYGKIASKLMHVLLIIYLFAYTASCINQAEETLQLFAYTDMNSLTIDLFLMAAVAVYAVYSIKGMAKTVSLMLPIILVAIVMILALCHKQYDVNLLTPILGYGAGTTAYSGVKLVSEFGGIVVLGVFGASFGDHKTYKKTALWAIGIAAFIFILSTLCYNMAVPYTASKNQLTGVMGIAQANYTSRFMQRIESVFIAVTVMATLLLSGVGFLAIKKTYCHIFSI